eukprot:GHRQ01028122.1.p2 GENE.GHRQ01028122.1~~GHRQ01028122.1.p2  ORF type:complete len:107 (-),score=20.83 GHRQ01028122.1:277-597(-)
MAATTWSVMGCFVVSFPCSGSGPGIGFAVLDVAGHGMLVNSSCIIAFVHDGKRVHASGHDGVFENAPSHMARVGCAWTCICPSPLRDPTAADAAAAHSCAAAWGPS